MAKRRGKASKGKEEPLNHSISNKGVKKHIKKSRKTNETSNPKVAHSTSSRDLVRVPTHASVTTSSIPVGNDQKKHKETETEGKKHASGFIFMCNGKTKLECYEYRVFGLPKGKIEVVKNINHATKLFLFDTGSKLLYGIYQATGKGALDLEPTAFNGQFQAQVKFKIFKDCLPLPESAFKHAIKDNYEGSRKFRQELSSTQVKNLISLFRPIAKQPSAKRSHVRPNVAIRPSFRSTRTKEVVKSYPLENLPSGVRYLPTLETRPQHDVHHGQYDPFEPEVHVSHSQVQPRLVRIEAPPRHVEPYYPEQAHEVHVSHSQVQPRLVRIEAPPRHVEPYHPEQAHEAYFPEKSFIHHPFEPEVHVSHSQVQPRLVRIEAPPRHVEPYHPEHAHEPYIPEKSFIQPPDSYESIRNTIETNKGDRRFPYGRQYQASQLLMDREDVTRVDYTPGYYSQRLSPTTLHTVPLSQAGSSAYHSQNRLPSPYRLQNRLPSPTYRLQNRLPSPTYRSQNRLPSPHRSQNRLPSPHRSYYSVVASQDRGRVYAAAGSPQGGPASGNLNYGESNLPITSYYYPSAAATRPSYR